MLPREEAAAGFAVATALFLAMGACGFAPVFLTAVSCFGAETGVFAFADFLTDFLAGVFAAGFPAALFAFLTAVFFFAFLTATPVFLARLFFAAVLATRCDTFLVFFFFEGFFLA